MKCAFCHKTITVAPTTEFFKCSHCGTTQERMLLDRPYLYTVGNGSNLEAPHVPVSK